MVYEDKPEVSGQLFQESSHYISQEMSDFNARATKWLLVSSPVPMISILLLYLYIIYVAGPRFMKNRKPYSLKVFMQCYNVFQVVVNFWLLFTVLKGGKPFSAVWKYCDSFDKMCGRNTEKLFELIWWGLIIKIIDLSETVVFVLRKKYQQVSTLHVYHHISTVVYVWVALRYFTHGHIIYTLTVNATVHIMMYSYYFLSTCGPKVQQRVFPFKKWLTILQMVQIVSIILTCLPGLTNSCNKKGTYLSLLTFLNGIPNISLFWNFYRKSYKKSKAI